MPTPSSASVSAIRLREPAARPGDDEGRRDRTRAERAEQIAAEVSARPNARRKRGSQRC